MGGRGSGTWYRYSSRSTTDGFWQFKIKRLREEGLFDARKQRFGNWQWYRDGEKCSNVNYELNTLDEWSPYIRLQYTNKRSGEEYNYKIRLSTTTPHYGGKRWWFHCPAKGCGRRVGVLYVGGIFACRHCYNLAYPSQNQTADGRYTDRAFALAHKLGLEGNVMDGFWGKKPKGMHWKTFNRKKEQLDWLCEASMVGLVSRLGVNEFL